MSYIGALNVGTTFTRCHIYDTSNLSVKGRAEEKIKLQTPAPGQVTIDPEELYKSVVNVVKNALTDAKLTASNLKCLGISTHRNNFITWDKRNGKPYHDIITWRDTRADEFIKEINVGDKLEQLRNQARNVYKSSKDPNYRGVDKIKFKNFEVLPKLHVLQKHNPDFKKAIDAGHTNSGNLDAWLLYRFGTGVFASDYSNLSTTAYFNPYNLKNRSEMVGHFKLNASMVPKPVDNSHDFKFINQSVFGARIKVGTVICSQSAAMYGNGCFTQGDATLNLGSGAFLDYTCGPTAADGTDNTYPIIAWSMKKNTVYGLESLSKYNGAVIEWALKHFMIPDIESSSSVAKAMSSNHDLYFIPAFDKLENPITAKDISGGFVGLTYYTLANHKLRAILESLAYQATLLIENFKKETGLKINKLKVNGGVAKNDFVCQLLADCSGLQIDRSTEADPVSLGTTYISGLNLGIWKDQLQLQNKIKAVESFQQNPNNQNQISSYNKWKSYAQNYLKID